MKCIVYGLYSSRKPDELRYIGQTTQTPKRRLSQHRCYAGRKRTALNHWFTREVGDGFDVYIRILSASATLHVSEQELIALHRANGSRLLNHTDGGEGTLGWRGNVGRKRPDLTERNRRNAGKPGRPMSPENKAKLIAANKSRDTTYLVLRNKTNHPWLGKQHKEETKEKQRAAHMGRVFSEETRRKIGLANSGRIPSADTRMKMSAAQKAAWELRRG